jgi:hypothetical protein
MTQGEYLEDVTAVAVLLTFGSEYYACAIAGPSPRIESRFDFHVRLISNFARDARLRGVTSERLVG